MTKFAPTLLAFVFLAASPAFAKPQPMSLTVDHGTSLALGGAASSVFVANPEIADVQVMSPTQIMIFGKRTGQTSFMATDSKGTILAERTLVVSQDLAELRQQLDSAIPGNAIKASPIPGGIVLTGTAKDATSVADAYKISMRFLPAGGDIINRVSVTGSNQIQIRVRFAEVQRNVDNSLGFNWQNLLTAGGGFTLGLATGNGVHAVGSGVFNSGTFNNTGLFPRPNNATLSTPNDVLGAAFHSGRFNIDTMIDALAQSGFLTILAEPSLTAMSGETANFLAGGEFPIPVPQGNNTISIQFQPYGISLAFTPTLLSGDRISLHVRPEVSELTETGAIISSNIAVPALITRKAETTVEVASGESFAIAGLMNNNQTQSVTKFPILGDIPILGTLFRSDHFINGQTELMVIITPYIVKPSKKPLALPTDGFAPPTESERLLGLRQSSADPNARPVSGEPVGVMASPSSAPLNPVTTAPEAENELVKPPHAASNVTRALRSEPEPAAPLSIPPVPATATPSQPLVLHPSSDADKRSGGLLVE